jgi:hypothetical protein
MSRILNGTCSCAREAPCPGQRLAPERVLRFVGQSQQNFAPGVYRVGTLAESRTRSAIPTTAAQREPVAMLDPFSLGTVRKGSAESRRKEKTAL